MNTNFLSAKDAILRKINDRASVFIFRLREEGTEDFVKLEQVFQIVLLFQGAILSSRINLRFHHRFGVKPLPQFICGDG